jgi:N-acetylglucosaminyldiphosphoundecaprenol N-acetyl-beta-D-mannosaminyltransferase
MKNDKIEVLKIKISKNGLATVLNQAVSLIEKKEKFYLCAVNAFMTVKANENKKILDIVNTAKIVIPDGMSLVWVSRKFKKYQLDRISGFDFFYEFSKIANEKDYSFFFMGGKNSDVLVKIKNRLKCEFNNILLKGYYSPSLYSHKMPEEENKAIIDMVNACKPDVLWIGISSPKQEEWIFNSIEKLDIKMACCVGAVFDFYSGEINRAPVWMQNHYLEWLYRMYSEPKRLFKKYVIYNTKFMIIVFKNLMKGSFLKQRYKF